MATSTNEPEEIREPEKPTGDNHDAEIHGFDIHDKVFNANQVWEGKGGTKRLRLDEINSVIETQGYEQPNMNDASAADLVEMLLKRAGVAGHWFFGQCADALAEAILRVVGPDPAEFTNPQAGHRAREVHARALGYTAPRSVGTPDHSNLPDGFPKPTAEEAEETRKAQERATAAEKAGGSAAVSTRGDGSFSEDEFDASKAQTEQAKTTARGKSGSSSRSTSKKNEDELKRLLGDGEDK